VDSRTLRTAVIRLTGMAATAAQLLPVVRLTVELVD
jgi:hypothetical protein